jgi:ABC-type sugar transport system ATPase subunit
VAGTASAFAVELRGVGEVFGEVVALTGINLEVPRLPKVGFVGPSGGGKLTLLRIVADDLEPDTGLVRAEDVTTARQRLARCALMPQRDLLLPWRTALDNAAIGLENRGGVPGRGPTGARARSSSGSGWQASRTPGRATAGRRAPAGGLPADPDGRPRHPPARWAVRRAQLDHALGCPRQ